MFNVCQKSSKAHRKNVWNVTSFEIYSLREYESHEVGLEEENL